MPPRARTQSEGIKAGVFPAWSGDGLTRYNLDGSKHGKFKFGPPSKREWQAMLEAHTAKASAKAGAPD